MPENTSDFTNDGASSVEGGDGLAIRSERETKQRGAPRNNSNATVVGIHSKAWRSAGVVPATFSKVRNHLAKLHKDIEAALVASQSHAPTVYQRQLLSTALRCEGRARLLERRLADVVDDKTGRTYAENLPLPDLAKLLESIGKASSDAARALQMMGLDVSAKKALKARIYNAS